MKSRPPKPETSEPQTKANEVHLKGSLTKNPIMTGIPAIEVNQVNLKRKKRIVLKMNEKPEQ